MNDKSAAIASTLDRAYEEHATRDFIPDDPIQIPHRFNKKEDIEISGFLAATIAWGKRITIIRNASLLLDLMDGAPHDFILNHLPADRNRFKGFVHRTFSEVDAMYFMESLQRLYLEGIGLEKAFGGHGDKSMQKRLHTFRNLFFESDHLKRTVKHVSDPAKGSTAKRLNMYLRWMVRSDKEGIDFGIWESIKPKELMIPLDVHTSTVGRELGLLKRKQNDWKAVEELTEALRLFDADDPIKYDLALFGMGVSRRMP
ncbi:MAG: TIGR02757 family protein [Cryomorphaceae bacterium]